MERSLLSWLPPQARKVPMGALLAGLVLLLAVLIGVGCLVLAFAVVFGSCWYCKSKVEEGMTAAGAELSRISLSFSAASDAAAARSLHACGRCGLWKPQPMKKFE